MNIYFYILSAVIVILYIPVAIEIYLLRKTIKTLVKKTAKLVD